MNNKIPIFTEIFYEMTSNYSLDIFRQSVDVQVRYSDFDLQGHVSNTVYQCYYDRGKQSYLDLVIIDWNIKSLVGASVKIDYLKPILYHTPISVKTRVAHIGNKSITFEHCIVNRNNNEVLSTSTAVMVYSDFQNKQSMPVPEDWRMKITAFEDIVEC